MSPWRLALIALTILATTAAPALAQRQSARVHGTVVDSQGHPVPDAAVVLADRVETSWILLNRLLFNSLLFSIPMAWLYNRTNGSILAPVLFHAAMNAFGNQFSVTAASVVLFAVLVMVVIISDGMWKKLPPDHPAVYQAPMNG